MLTFNHKKILYRHVFLSLMLPSLLFSCGGSSDKASPTEALTPDSRPVSVAHMWNDVVLTSIRTDRVRPPVQARNLFHSSAAMYDAWAIYSKSASTYLLGKTRNGFSCPLSTQITGVDVQPLREKAISYAMYRIIKARYKESPGYVQTMALADQLMLDLGLDKTFDSVDISSNNPAALGNYIASCYLSYGLQDGSNEANSHANTSYTPSNPQLDPKLPGNPNILNMDLWQPLTLINFVDQSGNTIPGGAAAFVGAEWGQVKSFSLTSEQMTTYTRNNFNYPVYLDPGKPPSIYGSDAEEYQWTFSLVAHWSSHLDPTDGVMIDISPASIGNNAYLPNSIHSHRLFYNDLQGGDSSAGYKLNPVTNKPYTPQIVPRGDYTRVLAEFWADGPNSETPPGHWFYIFNTVSQHALLKKRFEGVGSELGSLEWDVKGYFTLGGAMHDSAIASWGIKGWYDAVRPVSAIRAMADLGQSTSSLLPHYNPKGLPLATGYVELVGSSDALAGINKENVGKIKVKAWKGPSYINNPATDTAGVDWILAENWWPYQRPSFISPPFAGYVSGHSTFSRAAAEVLTAITGDAYFPGGMSSFSVKKNEFLVFEEGPSVDMTLQWATYRDAADQCSLSRIWGGIHPPMDDIAGRIIGEKIGTQTVSFATRYFNGVAN